jgi:hypothetical protein
MAYRRKALPRIYFGLTGITIAVLLVVFRFGIFAERENELVLGIFVFVAGYCGLISGCLYWVKAKKWSEAVVVIGLLPVVILFIPYVRLIFLAVPNLLLSSMVMMPLILLVVVAVLPDKSGVSKNRRTRRSHKEKHELSGVME